MGRVSESLTRDTLDTRAVVQGSGLPSSPGWEMGVLGSGIPEQGCSKPTCCSPDAQECTLKVQDGKFKLQDLLVVPMQRVLKYHLLLKVRRAGAGQGPQSPGCVVGPTDGPG